MDHLIPIINQLQDVFATVGSQPIDLPQIAVVGSQSVGKSSVLENIVGRDFLPRGSNIVTRRPLILQLFNTKLPSKNPLKTSSPNDEDEDKMDLGSDSDNNDINNREYGQFLHKGSKKYFDFNEIRKEIETETSRIAPNKAISSLPISLKIYSPKVLNLTLIDLPGMTKVPVGNQDKNIELIIKNLILSFIKKPNCLILAVSSATSDLATSDAIQLAKRVDPKGTRTLGVITKIDLMDQGVDACDMLNGLVIPLRLGYVGIVNRSQKDINNSKKISDAKLSEKMFFKTSSIYRSIADRCGTEYLSFKLNKILINHIKKCLPQLRESINLNIKTLEDELLGYGIENELSQNKGALLLDLISKFSENFTNLIDGSGVNIMVKTNNYRRKFLVAKNAKNRAMNSYNELKEDDELFGGARILYIFDTEFQHKLGVIKSFHGLSDQFILNSMRNASGIRNSLFIPEMCFENLVKIQIEKLRKPCLECVDLVFAELKRITQQSQTVKIQRFTKFQKELNSTVHGMLKNLLNPCSLFVNHALDIELAYIKTNHPDFISMDDVFTDSEQKNQYIHGQSNIKSSSSSAAVQQAQQINNNKHRQQQQQKQKKPNPKVWICAQCTLENALDVAECAVCSASRDENIKNNKNNPFNASSQPNKRYNRGDVNYGNQGGFGGNRISFNRGNITQREQMELLVIKKFIKSYFGIVKKNIADIIPKSIMFLLVNKSKQHLQQHLALKLYKTEKFQDLLSESPEIAKKRKNARDLLNILQKALNIINQVNDYQVMDGNF